METLRKIQRAYKESFKEIEVIPRQWVVTIGTVARSHLLAEKGIEPSQEEIENFVGEVRSEFSPTGSRLRARASKLIGREFREAIKECSFWGIIVTGETKRKAREVIIRRYEDIDKDPERNFSYLDTILFPEE